MLLINGAGGLDYEMQASANLTGWIVASTTNSPVVPFSWTNSVNNSLPMSFIRVLAGPPLP